jgi:hypothetical protein
MASFQKIILIVALIILILCLVFIGVTLGYSKNNTQWPPLIPQCPDYWFMDPSSNCVNIRNLGTCSPQSGKKHLIMNFNTPAYTGSNGNCAKYTWANNCNVSWDGITYGVNNPCSS